MGTLFFSFFEKWFNNFGGITILSITALLLYAMHRAHHIRDLDWTDLVTSKDTSKVSLTKFLQLVGGITGTWMVVYTTLHDKLTYDLLLVYLTYVGAIDGWSKFIAARYPQVASPPKSPPDKLTT